MKTFINEYSPQVKEGVVVNSKSLPDGRLVRENITTTANDDGSKDFTHEIMEEVVPMRVAERIHRKIVEVPVEESHEKIAEDGTVQTDVRKLDSSNLDLNKPTDLNLNQVFAEIKALRRSLTEDKQPETSRAKEPSSFLDKAGEMWSKKKVSEEGTKPPTQPGMSVSELSFTTIAWIVFAITAGLVTYSLF